jgi:hypothetical protein
LDELAGAIAAQNAEYPESVRPLLGGESRLVSTIQHLVVPEMLQRVARS